MSQMEGSCRLSTVRLSFARSSKSIVQVSCVKEKEQGERTTRITLALRCRLSNWLIGDVCWLSQPTCTVPPLNSKLLLSFFPTTHHAKGQVIISNII